MADGAHPLLRSHSLLDSSEPSLFKPDSISEKRSLSQARTVYHLGPPEVFVAKELDSWFAEHPRA
jgi:hypothetical protein